MALSTLINNLLRGKCIGYRDSQLTRILQPSLNSDTNVIKFCMISPTIECLEESLSTLNFAARMGNLILKPKITEKYVTGNTKKPTNTCNKCNIVIITDDSYIETLLLHYNAVEERTVNKISDINSRTVLNTYNRIANNTQNRIAINKRNTLAITNVTNKWNTINCRCHTLNTTNVGNTTNKACFSFENEVDKLFRSKLSNNNSLLLETDHELTNKDFNCNLM